MKTRISIAVVGLNFGRHIVNELIEGTASELFQLVAVCDQNSVLSRTIAVNAGVKSYTDLDELLTNDSIATIGLFTGPVGRAALIKRCLDAGKDVITTKPFENDPDAALEILEKAEAMGRVVHINSPSPLLSPDLAQIAAWREEWQLGRPVASRAEVWCSYREQADGSWYDEPEKCPVAPIFRLGIYLINDLVRIFGPAKQVHVLHSKLFGTRPTPDNAQLGILFQNGAVANIFASFCINDGDEYRNSMTLNFENGTIYRNVGPHRDKSVHGVSEMNLVMNSDEGRGIAAKSVTPSSSGEYQWEEFAKAVRGEKLVNAIKPREIIAGLEIINAMACAEAGDGVALVRQSSKCL